MIGVDPFQLTTWTCGAFDSVTLSTFGRDWQFCRKADELSLAIPESEPLGLTKREQAAYLGPGRTLMSLNGRRVVTIPEDWAA